jgi:hypothetical protein
MKSLALLALVAGCSKSPAPAPTPVPTTPTPPTAPQAAVVPKSDGPVGSKDLVGLENLIPIMRDEAANRPKVDVTPEKLFDALDRAGMQTKQRKQVLARSAGANFCAIAKLDSPTGIIGVVACEYESPAIASTMREALDKSRISNVSRETRGGTLVTITNVETNRDARDRVFQVLRTL